MLTLNQNLNCPEESCELLIDAFLIAERETVPIIRRNSKIRICPFFDKDLQELKRNRRKMEKKFRKIQTYLTRENYLESIQKCKKVFRQKKTAFFEKNINKNLDLKKKFNCFNQLLGIRSLETLPSGWGTDKEIAEKFNIFFKNKISKIRNSIENKNLSTNASLFSTEFNSNNRTFLDSFHSIDVNYVNRILNDTSNTLHFGPNTGKTLQVN